MSTRKALAFSYLDRYATLLIMLISSMIIARLLSPAEMGVYSITVVLIGFMAPFRDFGASQYLIQQKELTTDSIRAIWAIQLSFNWTLGLFIFSTRNLVADFYHNSTISSIMAILAINSFLIPFGALTGAWLTRELRFDLLAIIRFSGTIVGTTTSILFARSGHGSISLAYGALCSSITNAAVSLLFRPKHFPWLPGIKEIPRVMGFGSTISGITILNQGYHGAPELILGKIQGMSSTGLFGRAQGLVNLLERLLLDSVHAVALPSFSKMQDDLPKLGDAFINSISILSVLGWTLLSFIALMARPAITLLYGDQWLNAVTLTRILCISMNFMLLMSLSPPLLISIGHRMNVFWLMAFTAIIQAIFVLIGGTIGLEGAGLAITCASMIISSSWLYVAHLRVGFSLKNLIQNLMKSLLVTIGAMIVPMVVIILYSLINPSATIPPLFIGGIGMILGFVFSAKMIKHTIWEEIVRLINSLRS